MRNRPLQAPRCVSCVSAAGSVAGLCVTRRNTPVSVLRYGGGSRHAGACRLNNALYCTCALTADAHRRGSSELCVCVCVCSSFPPSLSSRSSHNRTTYAVKFIYSTHVVLTAGARSESPITPAFTRKPPVRGVTDGRDF